MSDSKLLSPHTDGPVAYLTDLARRIHVVIHGGITDEAGRLLLGDDDAMFVDDIAQSLSDGMNDDEVIARIAAEAIAPDSRLSERDWIIAARYHGGDPLTDIAADAGISPQWAGRIAQLLGLSRRRHDGRR